MINIFIATSFLAVAISLASCSCFAQSTAPASATSQTPTYKTPQLTREGVDQMHEALKDKNNKAVMDKVTEAQRDMDESSPAFVKILELQDDYKQISEKVDAFDKAYNSESSATAQKRLCKNMQDAVTSAKNRIKTAANRQIDFTQKQLKAMSQYEAVYDKLTKSLAALKN